MKYGIIFVIALISLKCSTISLLQAQQFGDFTKYVNSFMVEAHKRNLDLDVTSITISKADMLPPRMGGCVRWRGVYGNIVYGEITLNAAYWDRMNENTKEEVIWHELGHCVLDREHRDDEDEGGRPLSFMHSGKLCNNNPDYNEQKSKLTDELFNISVDKSYNTY